MPKHLERIAKDRTRHGNETHGVPPQFLSMCGDTGANYFFPSNVNQRTRTRQSLAPGSGWKLDAFRGTGDILAAHEMGGGDKTDSQI